MEKMNIVSFSLQELYNGANKRFSFHDGCLVSTYHGIDKNKIEQKCIARKYTLYQYAQYNRENR